MVKLTSLKNDPNNRIIRATVDSPFGPIKVFEPTIEDVEAILNLQDIVTAFNDSGDVEGSEEGILDISESTIVMELFPRLTDLEVDYMDEAEVEDIISHPNLALSQVKLIVAGIVSDVYKMLILTIGTRLKEEELLDASAKIRDRVTGISVEHLTKSEEEDVVDAMKEFGIIEDAINSKDPDLQKKVLEETREKFKSATGGQLDDFDEIVK